MSSEKKFQGRLLGMGNPLLDMSANVDASVLTKYDVKLDSAILAEDMHLPLYKELAAEQYGKVQYIAGGATQNTCRVAQWMLNGASGKTNPDQVAFFGCIGENDDYGKQLAECAAADGVLAHYMRTDKAPTGTCAALIVGGERALIANLGAANCFAESHLNSDRSQEIMKACDYFYCAGFFLTVSVPSLLIVAEHASVHNKTFCLNLSAPFIVDFFADQLSTAMPYADYVFGNEGEAAAYAKKNNLSDDIKEVALAVAALPKKNAARKRTVVFTQGAASTMVAFDGKVTEYPVDKPLAKDAVVDTNGAGDAFVGGFLATLMQQPNGATAPDIAAAVQAGHWAAGLIVQTSGTTLPATCAYEKAS